MEASPKVAEAPAIALFDVAVRLPAGKNADAIFEQIRNDRGFRPDKAEALITALASMPKVKVGASVTMERAEKAKADFVRFGLEVSITPVLSLADAPPPEPKKQSRELQCPACTKTILPTDDRRCPGCGVYIDKVLGAASLRKKILEEERAKLGRMSELESKERERLEREQAEARLRKQIRDQLEEELGLKTRGRSGWLGGRAIRALATIMLIGLVFFGGRLSVSMLDPKGVAQADKKGGEPEEIDKVLAGGSGATAGAGGAPGSSSASAGASDSASLEVDAQDSLIAAAESGRAGGKSISVEQAVAASQTLAASVMGKGSTGAASAGGAPVAAAAAAASGGASAVSAEAAPIPSSAKLVLMAQFATTLAELGQVPRALEVVNRAKSKPLLTEDVALAVTLAELEVAGWAAGAAADGRRQERLATLGKEVRALEPIAHRVVAASRIGSILARQPHIAAGESHGFLSIAGEGIKTLSSHDARQIATAEWSIAVGEALLSEIVAKVQAGKWARAQSLAARFEVAGRQVSAPFALARLHALEHHAQRTLGSTDRADAALAAALAANDRIAAMPERAENLRTLATPLSIDRIAASARALEGQVESESALKRARTLAALALLYADAGRKDKHDALRKAAEETPGLSATELATLRADLIVLGDLAAARLSHREGAYADAETRLKRVAGYLL